MGFDVAADAYDRFMGRYSRLLAPQLADLAGVTAGQRVARRRLRSRRADRRAGRARSGRGRWRPSTRPSRSSRRPARASPASTSGGPPPSGCRSPTPSFDAALAQLVVHFMSDPVAGLAEMARVTRRERCRRRLRLGSRRRPGPARACSGTRRASSIPASTTNRSLPGAREGHLAELFEAAGLREIEATRPVRRPSSTRASRSGGSRSPGASDPRAPTSPASTPGGRSSCASAAAPAPGGPVRRSRRGPGRRAASPEPEPPSVYRASWNWCRGLEPRRTPRTRRRGPGC